MTFIKPILIFLVFIFLIIGYFHPISSITQDLGRHILTGEIILKTKTVPLTNLYSYTYPEYPFINHHWLSEVIYYFIHSIIGFDGLLLFSTIIVILAFFLMYFFSYKKVNNIIVLGITSLIYIRILFERTDVRPEIFSFLFLSTFIVILYKNRQKFTPWIFLLPILELLWANIHIYFIVGIIVIGLFLIDSFISNLALNAYKIFAVFPSRFLIIIKPKILRAENKKIFISNLSAFSILLVIFLISLFTTLLNPNGLIGALYPMKIFQNYGYSIEENQNIVFLWNYSHKPTIIFFTIAVVLLFSSLLINIKKTKPIDWLLALFFTILGIAAIRNFPLFVFATFIPFVNNLSQIKIQSFNKLKSHKEIIILLLLIVIVWQIFSVSSTKNVGFGVVKGAKSAIDFYINNSLKGPIFNNFDIGSYLEYRLYPKEKVFVDGRPEAYPVDFFQKTYIPMQENTDLFKQISNKYQFNTIFFSHTDQTPWAQQFLKEIVKNPKWKMVYLDDYIVILLFETEINQKIIAKYALTPNNFSFDNIDKNNINSLFQLAVFFSRVGWLDQEEKVYQIILSSHPNFCPALYNLSHILIQKKSPLSSVFINRFSLNCK